jgi:hypothetical protein
LTEGIINDITKFMLKYFKHSFIEADKVFMLFNIKGGKKISPVTGCVGQQGCEMSRLPHFLDDQLTDRNQVVSRLLAP